jgi:hypothetical protein
MKLSDVMSAADLSIYAEVGLVLFLVAFVLVLITVLSTKNSSYEQVLNIPFDDGSASKNTASKSTVSKNTGLTNTVEPTEERA